MNSKPETSTKKHILIFAAFFLLALALTYPTVTHLGTFLPGDGGDDPAIAWNLWWVKFAVLNQPQNPFFTKMMFYPLGINLAFYTHTLLNGLTALPLLLNFGTVAASNLHMFFTFAAGGYGTFLLTRYLLVREFRRDDDILAAFFAGMVYAFASSKLFYVALGQFNIAGTHWIPFAALFFLKLKNDPRPRHAALTALFLVMQAYTEMTYASFLLVWMALVWAWNLFAPPPAAVDNSLPRRGLGRGLQTFFTHHIRPYLLLGGLFALGIAPILAAMLPDMLAEGDFLVVGGGFADAFSADLLGFFVPTMHHPLFGGWVARTGIANFDKGQHIFIGYSVLTLAVIGLWRMRHRRAAWFWAFAALFFALTALGPNITVNGYTTGIPGPFVIFQHLPIFKGNRYPSRYSVMLMLSLAPLSALGVSSFRFQVSGSKFKITHRVSRITHHVSRFTHHASRFTFHASFFILLFAFFIFEHLSIPLPQSDMRVPAAYQTIAADPDDFTVLDIPFAWRNGFRITGAYTTGFMFGQFYQTVHQKPMVQGNTSRNPELKFQYFTDAPILSSLRALETGHDLPPEQWDADRAIAGDVLRFFGIKYIVVHPETPGYLNNPQATIPYIESVLPVEKISESPDLILYRVNLPPLPAKVDLLRSPLRQLYFAEGWGIPTDTPVAQRKQARLMVPLDGGAKVLRYTTQHMNPFNRIWIEVNGQKFQSTNHHSPISPINTQPHFEPPVVEIPIPAEAVRAGTNDITLHFETLSPVVSDPYPVITIVSAGEEAGNLGHIYVNGVDVSPNRRGFNVAIIAEDGTLLNTAAFDTFADPAASHALAEFLAAAPDDAIIAIAVKDEASMQLTQEGVDALKAIGGTVDLRGQFRASYALATEKRWLAENIPAMEEFSPLNPAIIAGDSLGITEPKFAAVFERLEIEASPR